MTSHHPYLSIINAVKRQWHSQKIQKLTLSVHQQSLLLSGHTSSLQIPISYTAAASPGLSQHSCILTYVAVMNDGQKASHERNAFVQQAGLLMSPLEFLIDEASNQLCVRHSALISKDLDIQSTAFTTSVQWLTPELLRCTGQITQQELAASESKIMASELSEAYFEAITHE